MVVAAEPRRDSIQHAFAWSAQASFLKTRDEHLSLSGRDQLTLANALLDVLRRVNRYDGKSYAVSLRRVNRQTIAAMKIMICVRHNLT
jgi:hypothetical protein